MEKERGYFLNFLTSLLKDQPYVALAYMTGVLPIGTSGCTLNMFTEHTMMTEDSYRPFFGFTEAEADDLYRRYLRLEESPRLSRLALKNRYAGYPCGNNARVYNPLSLISALEENALRNYWAGTGPPEEIFSLVSRNPEALLPVLTRLLGGRSVPLSLPQYGATSMLLNMPDQIVSAMVVYGFLGYQDGAAMIPNGELHLQFANMLRRQPALGDLHTLAGVSEQALQAALNLDSGTVAKAFDLVYHTICHGDCDLTMSVTLVSLFARNCYFVEREEGADPGCADFIFHPKTVSYPDGIILELRGDGRAATALGQIRDRDYARRLENCTGRILGVGVGYRRKSGTHCCTIRILRETPGSG